jgi:hypothetical protein
MQRKQQRKDQPNDNSIDHSGSNLVSFGKEKNELAKVSVTAGQY